MKKILNEAHDNWCFSFNIIMVFREEANRWVCVGHVSKSVVEVKKTQALLTYTGLKDNIAMNSSRDGEYVVKTVCGTVLGVVCGHDKKLVDLVRTGYTEL